MTVKFNEGYGTLWLNNYFIEDVGKQHEIIFFCEVIYQNGVFDMFSAPSMLKIVSK